MIVFQRIQKAEDRRQKGRLAMKQHSSPFDFPGAAVFYRPTKSPFCILSPVFHNKNSFFINQFTIFAT